MKVWYSILFAISLCIAMLTHAQEPPSLEAMPVRSLPAGYLHSVSSGAEQLQTKLDTKTAKALSQWQKLEQRIRNKLARKDSVKAAALLKDGQQQFSALRQKLKDKTSLRQYIPSLDTLGSSLRFLQQNPALLSNVKGSKEKLDKALANVKGLEQQFRKAEDVKAFLKQRKQYLKTQLQQLGFAKELKKLNKQAYYYSAQLSEYKSLLKDHSKAERKALELLSRTQLFKDFMRKNSMLASLFRLPGNPDDALPAASLAGLQTRMQVNGLIQQQIAAGGPNAGQQLQQNIQEAQSKISELKNKLLQSGQSSSDNEMPDFKPNEQKTKSFLKRLELGTNLQSQKANGFFPTTSDIGLSVGYKLNDRSVIGIGGSYKVGWGQNIRHIHITHQGMGLRSFAEWKVKGSFWLSGGYERNFRSEIRSIDQLQDRSGWQNSGLIGVSKVISLKTKFFKKTKLMLAWDFLSYEQVPRGQPVAFRVGYSF